MKIKYLIIITILLSIFVIFGSHQVQSQTTAGDTYKPLAPTDFTVKINYPKDYGANLATLSFQWSANGAAYREVTDSNGQTKKLILSDSGYYLYRQELQSESSNKDGDTELIYAIEPGDPIESLYSGALIPYHQEEILGTKSKKIKFTLDVWDKSIGLTGDINNHITEVSTTVEIKSKNDVCAAQ